MHCTDIISITSRSAGFNALSLQQQAIMLTLLSSWATNGQNMTDSISELMDQSEEVIRILFIELTSSHQKKERISKVRAEAGRKGGLAKHRNRKEHEEPDWTPPMDPWCDCTTGEYWDGEHLGIDPDVVNDDGDPEPFDDDWLANSWQNPSKILAKSWQNTGRSEDGLPPHTPPKEDIIYNKYSDVDDNKPTASATTAEANSQKLPLTDKELIELWNERCPSHMKRTRRTLDRREKESLKDKIQTLGETEEEQLETLKQLFDAVESSKFFRMKNRKVDLRWVLTDENAMSRFLDGFYQDIRNGKASRVVTTEVSNKNVKIRQRDPVDYKKWFMDFGCPIELLKDIPSSDFPTLRQAAHPWLTANGYVFTEKGYVKQ